MREGTALAVPVRRRKKAALAAEGEYEQTTARSLCIRHSHLFYYCEHLAQSTPVPVSTYGRALSRYPIEAGLSHRADQYPYCSFYPGVDLDRVPQGAKAPMLQWRVAAQLNLRPPVRPRPMHDCKRE